MPKNEEIPAEDVEILSQEEEPKITKIRVDDETPQNPLQQFSDTMEEMRKIKPYALLSLIIGLIGIFWMPYILCPLAIALGCADLYWGSKWTKKIAFAGILIGILGFLNGL